MPNIRDMIGPPLMILSADLSPLVGQRLLSIRSTKTACYMKFERVTFRRRMSGGQFEPTSKDWYKRLQNLAVIEAVRYQEGWLLNFGLLGLLLAVDGSIHIVEKKPDSEAVN